MAMIHLVERTVVVAMECPTTNKNYAYLAVSVNMRQNIPL